MTEPQTFLDGRVTLRPGDCLDVLRAIPDASIDACVTDPPYALVSIGKRFGAEDAAPCAAGKTGAYQRASAGFMGKRWDTGERAFAVEFWAEVWRVLKPGAHVVAFGGTRSYHRLACAIEDAGFEIRDQLAWTYGSGFPKSHDVSKGIDKAAGTVREVVGEKRAGLARKARAGADICGGEASFEHLRRADVSLPATDDAREWEGWGTALKPAWEPICLARKPLDEKSVAANVLAHATGAINIDACRVHGADALGGVYQVTRLKPGATLNATGGNWRPEQGGEIYCGETKPGRWPANIVHDGSPEVIAAFPDSGGGHWSGETPSLVGAQRRAGAEAFDQQTGSAARFFYSAKADADDRLGSKHPTVKPVDLMQWLCRLVTPPGGTILDPFAGTGTTGEAAFREGFRAVLIEREAEYQADIARRMALCLAGADERKRESVKARRGDAAPDFGPLFGGSSAVGGGGLSTGNSPGTGNRADRAQALTAAE